MLNKKRVLGRGIEALLGDTDVPSRRPVEGERMFLCPVTDVSPNSLQPRKRFDDTSIKGLTDSIIEKGILEPLIVRKNALGYELIAGERRWRAAKLAGLSEVPVIVREATDGECLELALIENIQREDLNPVEEAAAYKRLQDMGLTQEDISKKVGKERATVANYIRILRLPLEVKAEIIKGSLTMGHARAILSVEGHGLQTELARRIITRGLSVREAEALAKNLLAIPKRRAKKNLSHEAHIEADLRAVFGTKVSVIDRNGKGVFEIFYFSSEERERILEMLKTCSMKNTKGGF